MEWLASLWQRLLDWCAPEQVPEFTPPRITVELRPFDWLEDYGTHWEPGSTAFWLEPRKESDLIAWLRKYRPEFEGEFEAAGLTVTVAPRILHPIPGHLMGNYDPRSIAYMQMQQSMAAMQAQGLYAQHQNALARQQGLLNQASGLSGFGQLLGFRLF